MLKQLTDLLPDELTQKIFQILPENIKETKADLEKELKAIFSGAFAQLDLVTREEFDIQTKVLQATRAKVEALEKQLPLMHNKS
jgi:ubiquinone biosynthesis accessory factor UbiK